MLFAAFALSLALHAIFAIFAHPPRATRSEIEAQARAQPLVVSVVRRTPTPRPPLPPRRAIAVPHVVSRVTRRTPSLPVAVAPAPTAAPPSPTPPSNAHQGCSAPDAPAGVVVAASPPPIPSAVRAEDVSGTAAIRVQLGADGGVTGIEIAQSTQSPSLDALAVQMARETQYAPARHACKTVASTYLFRVQFSAW